MKHKPNFCERVITHECKALNVAEMRECLYYSPRSTVKQSGVIYHCKWYDEFACRCVEAREPRGFDHE